MKKNSKTTAHNGFTLIELAIVLVIIGLITGGVVAGKTLIESARTRNIILQTDQYNKAIGLFQEKYYSLPGDSTVATSIWGAAASCPATSGASLTATCNGNGDGRIGFAAGNSYSSASATDSQTAFTETTTAWQHLSLAGLIENGYGLCGANNNNCPRTGGVYAGKSADKNQSFSIAWMERPLSSATCTFYNPICTGAHWLYLAGKSREMPSVFQDRTAATTDVSPLVARSIDTKLDDGLPGTGNLVAVGTWNASGSNPGVGCTTSATAASALYDASSAGVGCQLYIKLPY